MDVKSTVQSIASVMSKIQEVSDSENYRDDYPRLYQLEPSRIIASQRIYDEMVLVNPGPKTLSLALISDWAENFGNEGEKVGTELWLSLKSQRDHIAAFPEPILKELLESAPKMIKPTPEMGPTSQSRSLKGTIKVDRSKLLGRGINTFVYKGRWQDRDVAVKQIFVDSNDEKTLLTEIQALLNFDGHENIVQYFGMERIYQDTVIQIALELCNVTLRGWVEDKTCIPITVDTIDVLLQTTTGLAFLHENKLTHRDLKPENILILILPGDLMRVKICDFGISRRIPFDRTSYTLETNSGTWGWTPPEVLKVVPDGIEKIKSKLSTQADIWALGCLYHYVLFDGAHIFGNNHSDIPTNVKNNILIISLKVENASIARFLTLILKMVSQDVKDRPPASAILKHHIFWSKKTALQFITAVSNAAEQPKENSLAAECLEVFKSNALMKYYCLPEESFGWIRFLCPAVQAYAKGSGCKRHPYHGQRILELLRLIRNIPSHYGNLTEETQKAFGKQTDGFWDYFFVRFPLLIDVVWIAFEKLKNDSVARLGDYYCQFYDFEMDKKISVAASDALHNFVEMQIAEVQNAWSQ